MYISFPYVAQVDYQTISFLRGASQVGSAGIEKRKISNSCTGSPFVFTKTSISIKISVIARTKQWSTLIFSPITWGEPMLKCGIETKPERYVGIRGVSFPHGKQKQTVRPPGPFHEKRNNYIGLFSRFLVHSGAPRKQFLKSPCFVSSNFCEPPRGGTGFSN